MVDNNALKNELRILRSIFEGSNAAILVIDHKNRIIKVNRELEQITG